jgi:hypothetical protein
VQSIQVLVIGSDRRGGLAARLSRLGHRVVCAHPADPVATERIWDVVAVDDGGRHDPEVLLDALPAAGGPTMVVGEDPRRISGSSPVVFCFRDESDTGYAHALHMCAALGASARDARADTCAEAARRQRSGPRWSAAHAA